MMHASAQAFHLDAVDTPIERLDSPSPAASLRRVYVPAELLDAAIPAASFAVWAVLVDHVRRGRGVAWPSRTTLAARLGTPDAEGSRITRAVRHLEAAGWLEVERIHRAGKTRNQYRPLRTIGRDDSRQWVDLAPEHLAALQVGAITPQQLRALARWLHAAGMNGWTRDTAAAHAARYGTSKRTVIADRSALVSAGLLEVRTEPGRPTITARPECLPEPPREAVDTGAGIARSPVQESPDHRCRNRQTEATPVEATPVEATPPPAGRRPRYGRNGSPAATPTPPATEAASERDGEDLDRLAGEVLAALPREYQQQPRWARRELLRRLRLALALYGPAALVAAVHRSDLPDVDAVGALRHALAGLRADVMAGACSACGHHVDGPRPLCPDCNPDRVDLTPAELDAVERLARSLRDEGAA